MRPEEKSTPDTAPDDIREFSGDTLTDSEGGKNLIATVETNMGTFSFEFFPEDAPGTVENFVQLARDGFYDGTIFHRVIDGFMIQGGDPTGTGTGGPGYSIKAEFNDHKHVAGTVSMARSAHPDSAGSQFFVCVAPAPHLDGQYTAFGQVTDGLDVVQAIGKVKTDANDRPVEDVVMNTVTIEKKTAD
jgi:peptidyl-prolyl cis-trans isomerase B (cyclophilin B)